MAQPEKVKSLNVNLMFNKVMPEQSAFCTMKTVEAAELAALKGRTNSKDGRKWLSCKTENRRALLVDVQQLTLNPEYRQLEKTNNNGKVRQIDAPTLKTLVMQHLWIELVMPFYKDAEPGVARNCLEGRGVTSDKRDGSILKEAKRLFYDRRDLNFLACADQRQCYQRLSVKAYRRGMKVLRNIVQQHPNKTCIVTTHRPTVLSLCDRVYQIADGTCRVLTSGEVEQLITDF